MARRSPGFSRNSAEFGFISPWGFSRNLSSFSVDRRDFFFSALPASFDRLLRIHDIDQPLPRFPPNGRGEGILQVRLERLQRSQGSFNSLDAQDIFGRRHRTLGFQHASQAAVGNGLCACCLVIGRSELAMAPARLFHASYSHRIPYPCNECSYLLEMHLLPLVDGLRGGGKLRIVMLRGRLPETWGNVQPPKVYTIAAKTLFME